MSFRADDLLFIFFASLLIQPAMRWRKVSLIGVGLLGGSLGLALRKRMLATEVCGYVRREQSVEEAVSKGAVDHATTDLTSAVDTADLVVFCTPLAQMADLARRIAPQIPGDALITDVGSVKQSLVESLDPIFQPRNFFVGSHPMAGSEKMGVSAARADLFENATCVVTPTWQTPESAASKIEQLWREIGGRVLRLSPELHDELVSRSSHLPHVIAALLTRYVLHSKHPPEQGKLCANGFKDSTRIAASSPEMWRDIIMANREHIRDTLKEYSAAIKEFETMIESNKADEIENFFTEAKAMRDAWSGQCSSHSPE